MSLAWAAALSQLPWLAVAQGHCAVEPGDVEANTFWFGLPVLAASALSLSDGLRPALSLLGRWRSIILPTGDDNVVLLRPATVHDPI